MRRTAVIGLKGKAEKQRELKRCLGAGGEEGLLGRRMV